MTPDELRTRRKQAGLTQAALARAADMSESHLRRIESGRWPWDKVSDGTRHGLERALASGPCPHCGRV